MLRFRLATPPAFRAQLPAELALMAASAHAAAPSPERGAVRRPSLALALSLALHAFVLSLSFGGQGLGLPGLGLPWSELRAALPPLQARLSPPNETPPPKALAPQPSPAAAEAGLPPVPPSPPKSADTPSRQEPARTEAAPADRRWLARESVEPELWSVPSAASAPVTAQQPREAPPWAFDPAETARELQALQARQASWPSTTAADTPPPAPAPAPAPVPLPQPDDSAAQEMERLSRHIRARQEAAQREASLLEAQAQARRQEDAASAEAARQEAARQAARAESQRQEAARAEAQRAEAARQAASRAEAARIEAERIEAARMAEAERAAAAQAEAARIEAARQEAARTELARQQAARAEAARQEAARAEAARQEAARAEAARQDAERLEGARQAAARLEEARQAAAQAAAQAARTAQLEAAERREARLREIGRQLDEERAQRDAAAASSRQSKDLPFASSQRRGRLMGRSDPNPELVAYGEAWARKIQLDTVSFERLREPLKQAHFDALVTVAVRADGSVESVNFVRSSGAPALDAAIERVVRDLAHYPPFPPALAKDYDVIEIRRTWHFDTAIRLY